MDEIDRANEYAQSMVDSAIEEHRRNVKPIPKGVPGECEHCGEHMSRLVGGACAPCRDELGLP